MIAEIQEKIQYREYEFSKHAVDQTIWRDISVSELEEALLSFSCEVIEDYPDDKYGPSCLVLGFTRTGRPLHVVCSYPGRRYLKIITLYEPEPAEWTEGRIRRK